MDLVLILILVAVAFVVVVAGFVLARRRPTRSAEPGTTDVLEVPEAPPREAPEQEPAEETDEGAPTATIEAPPEVAEPELEAPPTAPPAEPAPPEQAPPAPEELVEEISLGERFRRRLTRTRNVLGTTVADLFGRGVSDEAWDGLEEALIAADVGVEAALQIVEDLRTRAREEGVTEAEGVVALLKDELKLALGSGDRTLRRTSDDEPTVWLVTGVNGTGKTTSIGKIAAHEAREGRSVVLGAADTFRAAAIEQLGTWAERSGARLVAKDQGADPASVAYDAYLAGRATDADVVIVDTAGRLHNKRELMDELGKVKRVLEKQAGDLEETLLVLDATTGQNGIQQARAFLEAVDVTGVILTKLDGTSKGGVVVAIQRELEIPVKLVGLGEDIDDLATFDPDAFVEGLFADLAVR